MAALLDWTEFQTGGSGTITDDETGEQADVTVTTTAMNYFDDPDGAFGTTGFLFGSGGTDASPNTTSIDFGENVENASFELLDVDGGETWSDSVTVSALDEDGNFVPVDFSSVDPAYQTVTDNGDGTYTISASGNSAETFDGANSADSVFVSFAGPVESINIVFSNGDTADSAGTIGINDISFDIVCFTPGTLIATPHGDQKVETLRQGDLVHTKDNGPQVIRWIGHKTVSGARLQCFENLRPVLIRKNAFGPNLPSADMHVSPQHRILMTGANAILHFAEEEVLAPAKGLLTDQSVTIDYGATGAEYIHILFDEHQIVYSNDLPTESFHPEDLSLAGLDDQTRDEVFDIFPALRSNFGAYGPSARMSVSVRESICLS